MNLVILLDKGTRYRVAPMHSGESDYLLISEELKKYLGMKPGEEVMVMLDESKHGKFVSFWVAPKAK